MSKVIGNWGEKKAAQYLLNQGFKIIDKNYRGTRGEIDLVTEKDGVLSFVEVKTWNTMGFEELEYSIDWKKQKKIKLASLEFLEKHRGYQGMVIQFDVVYIDASKGLLEYLPAAWGAD